MGTMTDEVETCRISLGPRPCWIDRAGVALFRVLITCGPCMQGLKPVELTFDQKPELEAEQKRIEAVRLTAHQM